MRVAQKRTASCAPRRRSGRMRGTPLSKWTVRRRTVRKKSRDAAPAPLPMTLHGEQYSGQRRRRALGEAGRRRACARRLAPTRRVRGDVGRGGGSPPDASPGWDAARDASIRAKRRTPLIAHRSSLIAHRSPRPDARRRDRRARTPAAPGCAPACRTPTVLHRTRSVLRCITAHRRRAPRNPGVSAQSRVASRFASAGTALA